MPGKHVEEPASPMIKTLLQTLRISQAASAPPRKPSFLSWSGSSRKTVSAMPLNSFMNSLNALYVSSRWEVESIFSLSSAASAWSSPISASASISSQSLPSFSGG